VNQLPNPADQIQLTMSPFSAFRRAGLPCLPGRAVRIGEYR
jgi:hypothetical protein